MTLYPLKFKPILKSIIWGGSEICKFKDIHPVQEGIGESWEVSGVKNNLSVVENGKLAGKNLEELIDTYKESLVGEKVYRHFGNTFPLLIKFIDAHADLSIQVHPDDEVARIRHNSFGKTEMWYVIDASENAFLYSGFEKELNRNNYAESVADNTFVDYLAKHYIKKGDVFFLPAGRVHAIGAGSFIAEIQQTSDITYRIYDYDRKDANGKTRELHTEQAKDAIDYKVYDNYKTDYKNERNIPIPLECCHYFTTNLLDMDKIWQRDLSDIDSFVIYICMGGSCKITDNNGNSLKLRQGETTLIPACTKGVEITPDTGVLMLETFV